MTTTATRPGDESGAPCGAVEDVRRGPDEAFAVGVERVLSVPAAATGQH